MIPPIVFDVTKQLDTFNKLHNQMPFIISKSINDIAFKEGRQEMAQELKQVFEVRNKTFASKNAFRIKRSNKNNLSVTIYHFKEEMGLQQFGGIDTPKGSKLAIPIRKTLSSYAGVPNNKVIPKGLTVSTLMSKAPKKKGQPVYSTHGVKPFVLKTGIFIRVGDGVRPIWKFKDKADHIKKLFQMQKAIERTYNTHLENYINAQYKQILKG